MSLSAFDLWEHMGLVARGVLFTLTLMSVLSMASIVQRLGRFLYARRQSDQFGIHVQHWINGRAFQELIDARDQFKSSPLCTVVAAAVKEYVDGLEARRIGRKYDVAEASERAVERTRTEVAIEVRDLGEHEQAGG